MKTFCLTDISFSKDKHCFINGHCKRLIWLALHPINIHCCFHKHCKKINVGFGFCCHFPSFNQIYLSASSISKNILLWYNCSSRLKKQEIKRIKTMRFPPQWHCKHAHKWRMHFLREEHETSHNTNLMLLSYLHFWAIWVEAHQSIPATLMRSGFWGVKKKSLS